ncbi:hypothetical protein [Marinicella rhabdoformis]|uniref:hypothetical protein n=1 Tax=Marinicella rhabdoformis TaxID=2580566 RepID=UPI0012AEC067|nr:hypothetical protein [Marinicella rhabdoformis]
MFNLFSCEWQRVRKAVFGGLLTHTILLGLFINFGLFNSEAIGFKISLTLLYAACGYLFGITQLNTHTKSSQWTYLVNRPIGVKHIYLALCLTALTAFVVVIVLPFFLATLVLDISQKEVIDLRHYQLLAYLFGITTSFYLVASFTVLIQKKSAHLLLMITLLPIISINMGGSVYWLLSGVLIWIFFMVFAAVKVNLNDLPTNKVFLISTAAAYQYVIYFMVISAVFLTSEFILDMETRNKKSQSSEPLNADDFRTVIFMEPQKATITGLYTSDNKYRNEIAEIELNKTSRIRKRIWFHPVKQQMPFMDENKPVITDPENKIVWHFSHNLMLFIGKDSVSNRIIGYLGANGRQTQLETATDNSYFPEVPWIEHDQIVVKHQLYQYQSQQQKLQLLFTANENEYLLNGLQHHGSVLSVITNQHLYLFDSINYHNDELPLVPQIVMPLPGDYNNLWDAQITEVGNKFILAFTYGKSFRRNIYGAEQLSYEFTLGGEVKPINRRQLKQNPSYLLKDLEYMLSPAWKLGLDYFPPHPSRDRYLVERRQITGLSQSTYMKLLFWGIFYALITFLLAQNRSIPRSRKWSWTVLNIVLGLPGVISFLLLNPKNTPLVTPPEKANTAQINTEQPSHV